MKHKNADQKLIQARNLTKLILTASPTKTWELAFAILLRIDLDTPLFDIKGSRPGARALLGNGTPVSTSLGHTRRPLETGPI